MKHSAPAKQNSLRGLFILGPEEGAINMFELCIPDEGRLIRRDSCVCLVGLTKLLASESPGGKVAQYFDATNLTDVDRQFATIAAMAKELEDPPMSDDAGFTPFVLSFLKTRHFGQTVAAKNGCKLTSHLEPQNSPEPRNRRLLNLFRSFGRFDADDFIHSRTRVLTDAIGKTSEISEQIGFTGEARDRRCRDRLAADCFPRIPMGTGGVVQTPTVVLTVMNRQRQLRPSDQLDQNPCYDDATTTVFAVGNLRVSSGLITFEDHAARHIGITSFMDGPLRSWLQTISNVQRLFEEENLLRSAPGKLLRRFGKQRNLHHSSR